jgi:hypothetical protein
LGNSESCGTIEETGEPKLDEFSDDDEEEGYKKLTLLFCKRISSFVIIPWCSRPFLTSSITTGDSLDLEAREKMEITFYLSFIIFSS